MPGGLDSLKLRWNLLMQLAIWAYDILAHFVSAPPTSALACAANDPNCVGSTEYLAKYGLAVVIGLSMIATSALRTRRYTLLWVVLALLIIGSAYRTNAWYLHLQNIWICDVTKPGGELKLRIKGEHLTKEAGAMSSDPVCAGGCAGILSCFENDPKQVWLTEEINERRVYLTATYFSVLPLYALGIIFTVQALYCASRNVAKTFAGHWKSTGTDDVGLVDLTIIIANNKIGGHLRNVSDLDSAAIQDALIKNETLTFTHGRSRTPYEMTLAGDGKALLSQESDRERHWKLFKLPNEVGG
jgi:hypothetical protein